MLRRVLSLFASPVSLQPLVELDPASLNDVAGGAGPHGGWGMPSAPPTVNPPTGDLWCDELGPHGGWKSAQADGSRAW